MAINCCPNGVATRVVSRDGGSSSVWHKWDGVQNIDREGARSRKYPYRQTRLLAWSLDRGMNCTKHWEDYVKPKFEGGMKEE